MDWVDKPQNYKDLYGILQLLRLSHLNNFPLKTLKLGWVAFHSVTFQLKCLDFQSNQYKKLVPVLSRFCNGLWLLLEIIHTLVSAILIIPVTLAPLTGFHASNIQDITRVFGLKFSCSVFPIADLFQINQFNFK